MVMTKDSPKFKHTSKYKYNEFDCGMRFFEVNSYSSSQMIWVYIEFISWLSWELINTDIIHIITNFPRLADNGKQRIKK